jgi:hypothetical protein
MPPRSDVLWIYANRDICRPLTDSEIDKLDLEPTSLWWDPARKLYQVMTAKVAWDHGCWFDFGTSAVSERVVIFICLDECHDAVDLAAWSPKEGRVGLWLGNVAMLGQETAHAPRLGAEALRVYPTPREWLLGARDGVVIVDHDAALPILYAASPISVPSSQDRVALLSHWRPNVPEIVIHE